MIEHKIIPTQIIIQPEWPFCFRTLIAFKHEIEFFLRDQWEDPRQKTRGVKEHLKQTAKKNWLSQGENWMEELDDIIQNEQKDEMSFY